MREKYFNRVAGAWTAILLILCIVLLLTDLSFSQGINTRTITTKMATPITLNPTTSTTLLFPSPFYGAYGTGIVRQGKDNSKAKTPGTVAIDYSETKPVMVLHPLVDHLITFMVVYMDGKLYTFELHVGDNPDVAVTLKTGDSYSADVAVPATVTPEAVVNSRPRFDDDLLVDLVDLAKDADLLQASYPQGYEGYAKRHSEYVSDDGYVRTTVKEIHRFKKQDAIVLLGTAENLTTEPVKFDLLHVSVAVKDTVRSLTMLFPKWPIPGKASVQFTAVLVGDTDGLRADLSLDNEYRLIVDTGIHPEASPQPTPSPSPTPPAPLLPLKKEQKP